MHVDHPSTPSSGWWLWNDQGLYLRAARAWASGSLDPFAHWYFPGYPLLAAAFTGLMPAQPFYIPDLLCLVAFGWLFIRLAEALAPGLRGVRIVGAAIFLATVAFSPWAMKSFIEPWTTTPTAVLTYASLLLAFRFWDRPAPRRAAALGFVTAAVMLFRPTDAAVLLVVMVPFAAIAMLRRKPAWRSTVEIAASGIAGAAIPTLVLASIHLAIYGWHLGGYIEQSGLIGFEWRLIPLRWVGLFVSPQPLIQNEFGLAQIFPWIVPGAAGMIACLVATSGVARVRHALVIGAVILHCLAYLAYRDMHAQGLLRFGNYHYFKWVLPVFGLYTVFLVALVWATPRARLAWCAGAVTVVALFGWRPEWRSPAPGYTSADAVIDGRTLVLPHGLHSVLDGVRVAAAGDFTSMYLQSYQMRVGDTVYVANADVKSFPVPGGLIFTTLRPIPPGRAVVAFHPGVDPSPTVTPEIGRRVIVFGWPNWGQRIRYRLHEWQRSRRQG